MLCSDPSDFFRGSWNQHYFFMIWRLYAHVHVLSFLSL
ncbi:hypothetical protein ACJIZ3_000036 [Penstemon smallii]|uniref:Uncharacterized protein n=1 Tax=Penstemon smallii TaxID=265156 RepID=A0ABD3RFC8_9LAMI